MSKVSQSPVLENSVVEDILQVEMPQLEACKTMYEYKITDIASRTVRKGNFRGPVVQISTRFFNEGLYYFCITAPDNGETNVLSFRKQLSV